MEPEGLGELIDRLTGPLGLYARQWSESPEDVVQEAFMRLAARPEPPSNPDAWLFRAVRNGAINAGIAGRRRRRHEAKAAVDPSSWFESGPDPPVDPEAAEVALASLPDDRREVIVARLWGGLSFAEVAEVAGISTSSAHRLYHAGLLTLKSLLEVPCREDKDKVTVRPKSNPT